MVTMLMHSLFIYLFIPFGPRPGTAQYCKSNKLKGGQKQQNSKNNKENKRKTQKKKKPPKQTMELASQDGNGGLT